MAEKPDFKTENDKLKKNYHLPDFKELNNELELGDLEKKEFLLRAIRRKMRDKLIFFCRILEGVLYPTDKSPLTAYESSFFTEDAKYHLSTIHKTMMTFDRRSLSLDVEDTDEKNATYIKDLWKHWQPFKQETSSVIVTMEQSWNHHEKENAQGYFG